MIWNPFLHREIFDLYFQSEHEQRGYLSQLDEAEECESTENELKEEIIAAKDTSVMVIQSEIL